MKRVVITLVSVLLISAQAAYGHPPSRIQLTYDKSARSIKGRISHTSTNPISHHIGRIIVMVNNDTVLEHILPMQEGESGQYVQYSLPGIEDEDVIRFEVNCSSFGRRVEELRVDIE